MKNKLKQYAKNLGISDIGVCDARVYEELSEILEKYDTPFTAPTAERISPFKYLKNARSIIMCIFAYYTGEHEGNLSKYVYANDYHDIVKEKLNKLCELLKNEQPSFEGYVFCDNSDLCDKYLAYMSGLGVIGKNHLLIHPIYGSYIFIGGIVTNTDIAPDTPQGGKCMECGKCKEVCPGRVFDEPVSFYRCASYISQKKGELSVSEKQTLKASGKVWGCDLCSQVCPMNKNVPVCTETFYPISFDIDKAMLADKKSFTDAYSKRAFSWRGKNVLKRNADIIIDGRK